MGGQHDAPAALPPGRRPGTDFTGGGMGLGAGLDVYGKSRLLPCSIPRRFNPIVRLRRPGRQNKLTSEGNQDI